MLSVRLFCFLIISVNICLAQKNYKLKTDKFSSKSIASAPWGVQFNPLAPHINIYYGNWKADELSQKVDSLVFHATRIGVKWVRFSIDWANIQDTNGVFHWEYTDEAIKKLVENQINIILCLNGGHKNFTTHNSIKDTELNQWAAMADSISTRYANHVKHWEIWNEPNTHWFWKPEPLAQEYFELVKLASKILKKNVADAKILAGSLARLDLLFADTLIKLGILDYIDVFSIHPYNEFPEAIIQSIKVPVKVPVQYIEADHSINDLKKILQTKNTPVWQAECGYPSGANSLGWTGNGPWGEIVQSKWMLRRFLTDMMIGSKVSIFFALIDFRENNPNKFNSKGLLTLDYKPKSAYYTFKNTAYLLHGEVIAIPQSQDFINNIKSEGQFKGIQKKDILQTTLTNQKNEFTVYWLPWRMQEHVLTPAILQVKIQSYKNPILVDLIKGEYKKLNPDKNGNFEVELLDYPLIITDESSLK